MKWIVQLGALWGSAKVVVDDPKQVSKIIEALDGVEQVDDAYLRREGYVYVKMDSKSLKVKVESVDKLYESAKCVEELNAALEEIEKVQKEKEEAELKEKEEAELQTAEETIQSKLEPGEEDPRD